MLTACSPSGTTLLSHQNALCVIGTAALEYGYTSKCLVYRKYSELLENTQHHATKLAPPIKDLSYSERLVKLDYQACTIEERDGTSSKCTNIHMESIQWLHSRLRWTHTLEGEVIYTNAMTIRQKYFSNQVTNTWNLLPADVLDVPSLDSFKARIAKHWRQQKYCLHSVHKAYNPISKLSERPRS